MAVDGSLIFNTKIDDDGFNKGTKGMSSKVVDLKNKISSTEAAIKNLKAEMEKTANTKVKTKVAEGLEKDIAKAKERLSDFYAEADRIGDVKQAELKELGFSDDYLDKALEQDKAWQQIQEKIDKAEAQVQRYKNALEQANAVAPLTKDTAEFQQKEQRLNNLSGQLDVYNAKLREAEQAERSQSSATATAADRLATAKRHLERTISALKMFANGAHRAGNMLKSAFSKTAGRLISNIAAHFKRANNSTNVLEKSLRRIKNTLIRMFFFRLVHSPIDAIKDGLGEIAKVSPTVNKNLSALKTESTYLKNSLAALAAPLVNLITPALTTFMQTLSGVTEKAGRIIAILTGQSYTKAVKVQQDYAASLDETTNSANKNTKALEKNQHALAGFDELNVMDNNSDDSSDSAAVANPMFQMTDAQGANLSKSLLDSLKSQDFKTVGKLLGDKINSGLRAIKWGNIKSTLKSWAGNIADFLNGFIGGTDWGLVGETVGNGLHTAVVTAYTFLTRIDWKTLGKSFGKFINGSVKAVNWKDVGKTIAAGFNALIHSAHGFVTSIDWKGLGNAIHTSISTALHNMDWNTLIDTLVLGINGIITYAIAYVGNPDFTQLGANIGTSLQRLIAGIDWDGISTLFSTLLIGALDLTNGFVLSVDWKDFGKQIAASFNSFFGSGGGGNEFLAKIGATIGNICSGLFDFVIGFFGDSQTSEAFSEAVGAFLSNIPWLELITKAITGGITVASWIIQTATKMINDFCEALANGFDNAKDDKELQDSLEGLGIALANLFIDILNALIGLVITAIPNLFIGAIKSILYGLSWLLKFVLGDDFYNEATKTLDSWKGFSAKDTPKIPHLATGAAIPANYGEFLAVLGDNKRETEVVSPLSTMKQAFMEALAESNFSGDSGEKEINLYIDGDKFFTWLIGKNNRYQKTHGQTAFGGGET